MLVRCRGKTVLEINLYRAKSCFCHIKDIEGTPLLFRDKVYQRDSSYNDRYILLKEV